MKRRSLAFLPLFVLAAVSSCSTSNSQSPAGSREAGPGGQAPGGRTVPTCADIVGSLVPTFGHSDPGWSVMPPELQKLPPGAHFCGSVVFDDDAGHSTATAILITDLWGQSIVDFYGPLVTSVGCSLGAPDTSGSGDQARVFTCGTGLKVPSGGITASGTWTFIALVYNVSQ